MIRRFRHADVHPLAHHRRWGHGRTFAVGVLVGCQLCGQHFTSWIRLQWHQLLEHNR